MIEKLDIEGIHMEVDDNIRRYVERKIGRLDRFLSKHVRKSAHGEVMLKNSTKGKNPFTCEVTLYLPKETINAKESTVNIFAATDIVEAKLQNQIHKYKELHNSPKLRRHLLAKMRKKSA